MGLLGRLVIGRLMIGLLLIPGRTIGEIGRVPMLGVEVRDGNEGRRFTLPSEGDLKLLPPKPLDGVGIRLGARLGTPRLGLKPFEKLDPPREMDGPREKDGAFVDPLENEGDLENDLDEKDLPPPENPLENDFPMDFPFP